MTLSDLIRELPNLRAAGYEAYLEEVPVTRGHGVHARIRLRSPYVKGREYCPLTAYTEYKTGASWRVDLWSVVPDKIGLPKTDAERIQEAADFKSKHYWLRKMMMEALGIPRRT
jgi:hypothetical protein